MWLKQTDKVTPVYQKIKAMILDLNSEIVEEVNQDAYWRIVFKHGTFIVLVHHNKKQKYMWVTFPNKIKDTDVIQRINSALNDEKQGTALRYGLISALTSPSTAYMVYQENNIFSGFDITTRIFPFERELPIYELSDKIQCVISVGSHGMLYMSTFLNGQKMEQKVSGSQDVMYS